MFRASIWDTKRFGELMLSVEHASHFLLFDNEQGRGGDCGRRPHTHILCCQTPFTEKLAWGQDCHDGLFADLIHNGQSYPAILDVEDVLGRFTLRVDLL